MYDGRFQLFGFQAMVQSLEDIRKASARFAQERDWQLLQSPKNLVMALSVEVAELLEHFQWLTEQQSRNLDEKARLAVQDEIADVLLYLVSVADELDVDLYEAVKQKMIKNEQKYPVELTRQKPEH